MGFKALMDYAANNGLECLLPSQEIYHKGPGRIFKGNPNNYITEIALPIKEG
jgi:effector-binding domain-containing protein